ncbi:hypothetical protein CP8484711_1669A, partial [Chlamydia psittaci 84-8471/1]
MVFLK